MPCMTAAPCVARARVSVRAKAVRGAGLRKTVRPAAVRVNASAESTTEQLEMGQTAAMALAASLSIADHASASEQTLSQDKNREDGKRGAALALGLSAATFAGFNEAAEAATEIGQTALDARIVIFGAFVPVLGWVAYNILGPGLNQLEDMSKDAAKRKGVVAGLGLTAAAMASMPDAAEAATELAQTALDARIVIFGAFIPVVGWVAYNILGPGLNQLEDMQKDAAKKKGVVAGLGLTAAAMASMPDAAEAATELAQTALDARIVIFGAFIPVVGWVAYNILGPGLNQLEDMQKDAAKKK